MKNNYSLYALLEGSNKAKKLFLEYVIEVGEVDIYTPASNFRLYSIYLYDFFDAQQLICAVRTDRHFKYVPVIDDKSLEETKTHIWSKHGLETREEAEFIMFQKAFQYLETKLENND